MEVMRTRTNGTAALRPLSLSRGGPIGGPKLRPAGWRCCGEFLLGFVYLLLLSHDQSSVL